MPLSEFLAWASTVGAAILAYALIEEVPALTELEPKVKRRAAYALSAAIAILALLAEMGMGYVPVPATWVAWLEVLFAVGTGAFGLATMIHGERQLE